MTGNHTFFLTASGSAELYISNRRQSKAKLLVEIPPQQINLKPYEWGR